MNTIETLGDALSSWMRAHQDELVEFVVDLMKIKSTTYHEGEAIQWLKARMEGYGFDEVRIDTAGNCIGRVGNGPVVVMADAHIDTVDPGDSADWGFDPLQPKIVDGKIHGRGIVDDKGCLGALVFAARAIQEAGLESQLTFWVSGSISEEDVEGSCVRAMMEEFSDIKPHMILVAESSDNHIIHGHKGRALLRMEVKGKAAHASAAWRGENALINAIPLMQGIDAMNDLPEDAVLGKGSIEVTNITCDSPSLNTIPGKVTLVADRRISCGESKEQLVQELQPLLDLCGADARIDVETVTTYTGCTIVQEDYFPSWVIPEDHPVIASAKQAFTAVTKEVPVVTTWDFCTNATYLCGITGIPCVGYGPGDESLCHSTSEELSIDELVTAAAVYATIAVAYAMNTLKS